MIATLAASALIALMTSALSPRMGRWVFLIPAIASGVAFVYFLTLAPAILSGEAVEESIEWIPSLGITLAFRMGALQLLLALVVTGVGAMILAYSVWYFESKTLKSRTVGLLTGFAASMLLLVLADDVILLVIGWELTSVFSYLLVGLNHHSRKNRSAAQTAFIVTTAGGLAMLVGAVMLGSEAGTYMLHEILAQPPESTITTVAVMLLLAGALSKSAIFPFHFWLPGAMAAPTPVSAFLHAAAMVKAGIYLSAALVPAFADIPLFRPTLIVLGVATMLVGAYRALLQTDIKVLLAHGTVSQLGLLMTIVGIGTKTALMGGLAMLAAHAMFKASLFMVVGTIDRQYGTRQLTKLGTLRKDRPLLAVAATLAAIAMAGLPPAMAFAAKEAGLEAAWEAISLPGVPTWLGVLAFAGIVVGSMGTVAYTLRFLIGTFFVDSRLREALDDDEPFIVRHGMWPQLVALFPMVLAMLGIVSGFFGKPITAALEGATASAPAGEASYLALWHGFTPALAGSAIAVVGGFIVWRLFGRSMAAPVEPRFSAAAAYAGMMRGLDRLAVEVTGRTQSGSLPVHVSTIAVTVTVLAGAGLAFASLGAPKLVVADSVGQLVVGIAVSVCALVAANTRGRLKTFLLMGIVGYGTAMMFLLHGAPDLALTQILAETVLLVLLVLVLRHLPKYFTNRPLRGVRWLRALLAACVGAVAGLGALFAANSRNEASISDRFYELAYSFGFGRNIVNVTLVDIRAWDTVGEISVLLAAATGVASLIFIRTRVVDPVGTLRGRRGRPDTSKVGPGWLRAGATADMQGRAPMLEMMTRLLFPVMLVVAIYLLFAGHNDPGGGFIAGIVAGLALCVRYLAAGALELAEAAPIDAGKLLGGGIILAALSLIGPVFFGGSVGQSYDYTIEILAMGEIHFVTSVFFDVGVFLVVLGTVLDFIRSLGAGIDTQWRNDQTPRPSAHSDRTVPVRSRGAQS